jgi:hypothetical protein
MILRHWLEHRPQMVEELRQNNQLDQAVYETQERTGDLLYELMSVQKMEYQAAWEIATREWVFLPTEDRPLQSSSATKNLKQKKDPPATFE